MKKNYITKACYISAISLSLCSGALATSGNVVSADTGNQSDESAQLQETRARAIIPRHREQKVSNLLSTPEYKTAVAITARQLSRDTVTYTYYNKENKVLLKHNVEPISSVYTKPVGYNDIQVFHERVSMVKVTLSSHTGVVKKTSELSFDTSGPIISGAEDVVIQKGEHFNPMEGVKAYDVKDGDLTKDVVHDSPINENTPPGDYEIKYAVADSDGNITTLVRKITIENKIEVPIFNVVNDKDFQLTGLGKPGAAIKIYVGDKFFGATVVGADGRWKFLLDANFKEGEKVEASQVIDGYESEKVLQIVSHLGSTTVNHFKYGYLQPYGLILEGSIDNKDLDLTNKDTVKKTINLVDSTGKVALSTEVANQDWYNPGIFNGYQATLTNEMISLLKSGEYKLTITLSVGDFNETQDLNVSTARTVGHTIFDEIEAMNTGNNTVKTVNKNGIGYLNIYDNNK